ncbi:MAG: dihydrolipoyl dehydrogenase [Deltaproteobacteria bacterium]|nr:dihydrolipoyl dehydrogenase [Deltaproteobacteria bacterium]
MSTHFDVVVIGGGPGGYIAAIRAAQLGFSVACVELEKLLGGTCLRVGCIPSKAMLESSEHFEFASGHAKDHGVVIGEVGLDLGAMMKRKDRVVKTMAGGIDGLFKKNGVTRLLGKGRLDGRDDQGQVRVVVDGADGESVVTARNVILATGSEVASLPGLQLDGDRIGGSTEALSWPEVPKRLCVIGAGVIGLELGSVWRRLGSEVTVLEYADAPLPGMDGEIRKTAAKIFKKQGMKLQFGVKVQGASLDGDEVVVTAEGKDPMRFDRVLVAIGRRPYSAGLGLQTLGIETDARGRVPTDAHLATSAQGVYAIGDLIAGPMLAHKAEEEGVAVAEYLSTGYGHVDYDLIPGVVYTDPEIASVGKTQEELEAAGVAFRAGSFPFVANGRARGMGSTDGFVKVLADAETDRVLGVHMIGPRVGELVAEAAMAMAFAASAEDISRICHAHPTLSEVTKEAALASLGRALNI